MRDDHGQLPENNLVCLLLDALLFLSRGQNSWLRRDDVLAQVPSEVVDSFDEVLGALQSFQAVVVSNDQQIRLQEGAEALYRRLDD